MKHEQYSLIISAQSGNKDSMEKLTKDNSGLIWSIVRKFSGRSVESEDLFQVGAIGLIKAINKFDVKFNVEFSTYAVPMIMGEIRRFLRDDGIIKVSRSLKETAIKAKAAAERISLEKGYDPPLSEIADEIGCDVHMVTLALESSKMPESIYKTVDDDKGSTLLIDKICGTDNEEDKILSSVALKKAIKDLPVRDRQILMLRYYKEKTQSEVAKIMGLSQVQISRIEKKMLTQLRENIG